MSIAVVIAAYNAAGTLERAVRSALDQTAPTAEVVVVDDGSTDATPQIISKLAASEPIIGLRLDDGPSGGPARPRNSGVRATTADRLLFLDADDELEREAVEALDVDGADVVYGDVVVNRPGAEARTLPVEPLRDPLDLLIDNAFPVHAAAVTREAFDRVGGFGERPDITSLEDWHFWQKLALSDATFRYVGRTIGTYHIGEGTLRTRMVAARVPVSRDLRARFPEHRHLLDPQLRALRRQQGLRGVMLRSAVAARDRLLR